MSSKPPSPSLLARLAAIDTPTVCNAIEVAQGRRGFAAYSRQTVIPAQASPFVGFARTATIAATTPPEAPLEEVRARRLEYFRSMADGPRPAVAVVEDLDFPDCTGAWWGEVHTAVHKGLGLEGAVTNGAIRDLDCLEPGFPLLGGSVLPSHAFVHVRDIGVEVSVFGLTVRQGDLVHADRHGALVVPPDVYGTLDAALDTLHASEELVLEPARRADFDIERLQEAWAAFENART